MDFSKIFNNDIDQELISVKYDTLVNDETSGELELKISDTVSISRIEPECVVFLVRRDVGFEPKEYFVLRVDYEVTRYFVSEEAAKLSNLKKDLSKAVKNSDSILEIVRGTYGRISALISAITMSDGGNPLVSGSFYYDKDND